MDIFKPAWASKNEQKALKAVENISDQNKLGKVAKNAWHTTVSSAAVRKLTDQSVLVDIATTANKVIRSEAVRKLTDQKALLFIAQKMTALTMYVQRQLK